MAVEFYNHLHVGDVQKYNTDVLSTNALYFDGITSSSVESELLALKNTGATIAEIQQKASELLEQNTQLIENLSSFKTAFPKYQSLIDKLQGYGDIDLQIFDTLSIPSGSATELEVWDSLIVHYTLNKNLLLVDLFQQTLKILRIRDAINIGDITTIEQVLSNWSASFIILPSPLFPLPFKESEVQKGQAPEDPAPDPILEQLESLYSARNEITTSFNQQNESLKTKKLSEADFSESLLRGTNENLKGGTQGSVNYDTKALYQQYLKFSSPEFLTSDQLSQLSKTALESIHALNIDLAKVTVPSALSIIDREAGKLSKKVSYAPRKHYVTNIGSMLFEIDRIELNQFLCKEEARIDHCKLIRQLNQENPETSLIQVLGMGYVNVIRQELKNYATGEIANIENILKGESKNKSHRNLKRTENFVETSSSTTHESETDQRSSERFEMDKETSKIASESTDLNAGISVTAGYGPVSVTAGLSYASSSASVEAQSQSIKNSKEITNRAVERIKETVSERRTQLTINEIEIISEHGIDNADGTDHINGFYYWVDKVYSHQVVNKGKRLMLEFMVPEPAAFHIFAKGTSQAEGVNVEKPIAPNEYSDDKLTSPLKSMDDITRDNYHFWGAVYGVQDLPIPPSDYETLSSSFVLDYLPEGKQWHDIAFNSLKVPTGYKADYGKLNLGFSSGSGRYIAGYLGNKRFSFSSSTMTPYVIPLDGERDMVPLSFRGHFDEYHMNVEVFCSMTPEKETSWKQQVYQAILAAYNEQRSAYEDSLTLLSINQGIAIEGDNPLINRETEKTELKKWGIEMLTLQRFGQFDAMKNAKNGHPEIHFNEAFEDGNFVKFFEQSIEWQNMTYVFYPYFWGRKPKWTITKQFEDTDPMFTKFLQAGFARVVVPVHPKFTEAILHYLSSGEIWLGQDLPSIEDDLYLSIVQEIQEAEDNTDGDPIGDPWEVTVPTSMVMLTSIIPPNLPGS